MKRLRIQRWRLPAAAVALAVLAALVTPSADAAEQAPDAGLKAVGQLSVKRQLLAKAPSDECFAGMGLPYPEGPPCAEGKAKVNQGYVWGLTKAGNNLWFGTGANVNCMTSGSNLNVTEPVENEDYVCEYGKSQMLVKAPGLPARLGDWRPPNVYLYNLSTKQLTEKTGEIEAASEADLNRIQRTVGLRSAGNHQGVTLLAGPNLEGGGINLFAFDSGTGQYLGSRTLAGYGNVRKFVVVQDVLYFGVGIGRNGVNGGRVLRWQGSKTEPFTFVEVAKLPDQPAELTVHEGRLFVNTWPSSVDAPTAEAPTPPAAPHAGIWMSPPLSQGQPGLNPEDADAWKQVWSVSEYEPDPLVARVTAGGALASYGGYLYWGTMHVPMKATTTFMRTYPPKDEESSKAALENTQRGISLFRARGLTGSNKRVEMLYGQRELPKFDPAANEGKGAWSMASTNYTPLYGPQGFGNPTNNYTWTMAVSGGRLFVGTMDWRLLAQHLVPESLTEVGVKESQAKAMTDEVTEMEGGDDPPPSPLGGDLYVFTSNCT
ncbi:MAG TPA: hypothetical protein VFR67_24320, partial [Pilimelia sp.]|nr:hypothetical protein [Pilimelia sp.]